MKNDNEMFAEYAHAAWYADIYEQLTEREQEVFDAIEKIRRLSAEKIRRIAEERGCGY